jgi:hypothetical protein
MICNAVQRHEVKSSPRRLLEQAICRGLSQLM